MWMSFPKKKKTGEWNFVVKMTRNNEKLAN
jgi:hypothetical protein